MKLPTRLIVLLSFGLVLIGCRARPQSTWLTPVRTIVPGNIASPSATPLPANTPVLPTNVVSPTAPLPTPPPLPFSPVKDGGYMYQDIGEYPARLWGAEGGYYRLPEAPNILIYLWGMGRYCDHPPQTENITIGFFFKVYGLTPQQLENTFPIHPSPLAGTQGSRFIYNIQDLRLPDGTSVLPDTFFYVNPNKSGWGKDTNVFSTPEPGVFATLEIVDIALPTDHFLRGGAAWHGQKTIDFLLELQMAPGFHLKGPLRLWVPISYYNGPPP